MVNRDDIKNFVDEWAGRGSEKSDAQSFWLDLIRVLGIDQPTKFIQFEVPIYIDDQKLYRRLTE